MADLNIQIIELALNNGLKPEALKELAKEHRVTVQHVRKVVRDLIRAGLIQKYVITPEGRGYLEENSRNE